MNRLGAALAWLLRAGLSLGFALLVLLALYVSLGRELMPWVAEYRGEVEQQVRELGLPLRIGRLEGRWKGLAPQLLAHDLQLGEGSEVFQLRQVRVVPDL